MLHASTQRLIHKLCALTGSGEIAWREGEGDTLVFDTEGYRVEVQAEPPRVRLLRTDGKELETASAAELALTPWPDGDGTYASRVSEMTRHALRTARGADVAISKILSSLSTPAQKASEPPPSPHTAPEPVFQQPHVEPRQAETAVNQLFSATQPAAQPETIAPSPSEPEPAHAPLPEPQFKTPVFAAPVPPRSYAAVREGFGVARSFAIAPWTRPQPEPLPSATRMQYDPPRAAAGEAPVEMPVEAPADPPIEPKVTSTGLFINGVGSKARQTVREEQELERANAAPAGPDVYKPWS